MIPLGFRQPVKIHSLQISQPEMPQVLASIEVHQIEHLEMVLGLLIPRMDSRAQNRCYRRLN
jgi:hypothetical protein